MQVLYPPTTHHIPVILSIFPQFVHCHHVPLVDLDDSSITAPVGQGLYGGHQMGKTFREPGAVATVWWHMGQSVFGTNCSDFFQRSSASKHLIFSHGKTFEKQLQQVFPGIYLVYYCFPSLLPKETNRIGKNSFQSIKIHEEFICLVNLEKNTNESPKKHRLVSTAVTILATRSSTPCELLKASKLIFHVFA